MRMTVAIAAMVSVAGVASARVIYSGDAVSARSLEGPQIAGLLTSGVPYSALSGPFSAFGLSTPSDGNGQLRVIAIDDYDSTANDDINLGIFTFIGGVGQANGVVFFDFFDSTGALVDGFGIRLSQAGDFIWTLTLGTEIVVPDAGFVQMSVDDDGLFGVATTGRWFLSATAPTVGTTASNPPNLTIGGQPANYRFQLEAVPTPAAAALAGLGGLVAMRRRR